MTLPAPRYSAQFLDTAMKRGRYKRLVSNRFFQAYVTAVIQNGPRYLCSIQRIGESAADGSTYVCVSPGYTPTIGDLVECVWRDENTAYILLPVGGTNTIGPAGQWHAEVWLNAAQSMTNNVTLKINFDSVESNPLSLWDTTNHQFALPAGVTGRVLVNATFQCANNNGILMAYYNGGEEKRGTQGTVASFSVNAVIRVTTAGQAIDLRFNNQGATGNSSTGRSICWAQFTYQGPL